jgi:uncharacterized protein YhaN
MVLWKDAFEKVNLELDVTKKKKQALEDLLNAGRISHPTFDMLSKGLKDELDDIETRRKALTEKMTLKLSELEQQLHALEFFLANTEMAYVAGDINSELYAQESSALDMGLEATKQELNWIKDVIIQLVPKETATVEASATATVETIESTPTETAVENAPQITSNAPIETPVEVTPVTGEKPIEQPSYVAVETATEPPIESTTATTTETPQEKQEG